jgi:hypothetical protein
MKEDATLVAFYIIFLVNYQYFDIPFFIIQSFINAYISGIFIYSRYR